MWAYCQSFKRTRRRQPSNRRGAALVEFALCVPMLVIIILGSIEATSAIFIRQTVVIAAYEAAREAIRREGSLDSASQRADEILSQRNVKSATVRFVPANFAQLSRGQEVTVEISAGMKANSFFFGKVLQDRTVRASTTMVRE